MGLCGSSQASNEKKAEDKKEQQQSTSSGATNAEPSAPKEEAVAAKKMEPIVPSGSAGSSTGATSGSGSTTTSGEPSSTSTTTSGSTSTKPSAPAAEKQQGEGEGEGGSSSSKQGESGTSGSTEEQKGEPNRPDISLEGKSEWQGAVNAKLAEMGESLAKRQAELENSGAMAPVDGVSLKDYSYTQAQISKDSSKYDQILTSKGLNRERWEAIDKEWQARMKADGATGSVMSLYGKYFLEAGQGQYGASSKEAVAVMSTSGQFSGQDPKVGGEEHQMTWERYCEIQGAQTAWALGGKDVNARLRSDFNMNAMDWANISAYWMAKMVADINMATSYGTLTAKYQAIYANKA